MLGGQRAIPAALERAGFEFHHNTIGEALSYATTPKSTVARVASNPWRGHRSVRGDAAGRAAPRHRRLPGRLGVAARTGRRRASQAGPTPCCCSSIRRCTPRASAPNRTSDRSTVTPVVDTDRGGKITWHGPGQLVGYPIVGLAQPMDVVKFVRRLEDSLIAVCAAFGLQTGRVEGRSGVWVPADGAGRPARSPRSASGWHAGRRCTGSR